MCKIDTRVYIGSSGMSLGPVPCCACSCILYQFAVEIQTVETGTGFQVSSVEYSCEFLLSVLYCCRGPSALSMAGPSGSPKISGRAFRVFEISGFVNRYPKFARNNKNPTFRVPENSGSGLPEIPDKKISEQGKSEKIN